MTYLHILFIYFLNVNILFMQELKKKEIKVKSTTDEYEERYFNLNSQQNHCFQFLSRDKI